MGRFVVHGVLIEEPKKMTTATGLDCLTILIEEKTKTAFGREVVNVYSVDFIGKAVNCIPDNVRLIGVPVVATGNIRSREYKGKYYNDLNGDNFTLIATGNNTFVAPKPYVEEPQENEVIGSNLDNIEIEDDDLPF